MPLPRTAPPIVAPPIVAVLFGVLAFSPLLSGCGKEEVDDEDDEVVDSGEGDTSPEAGLDCDEVELDIIGPAEPAVGDTWTLWLRCDGATLAGTMVLRFDPADFAEIDANNATFLSAGDAQMRFQVGSRRVEQEVTVTP